MQLMIDRIVNWNKRRQRICRPQKFSCLSIDNNISQCVWPTVNRKASWKLTYEY